MLQRCYDENYHKQQPTYKEVIVDERWHNFQNFCEDLQHLAGYEDWKKGGKLELDKDVLCNKMNIHPKIYSKNTCLFITKKENNSSKYKNFQTGLTYIAHRILDGYEEEFVNQKVFGEKWNLSSTVINGCIKGRSKTYKGWKFIIKGEVN